MFIDLHHEDGSIFQFHVKEMFCLDQSSFKRQVTIKCNAILYYKVIKIKQGKDKSKCTNQNLFMLFGDTVDLSVTLEEFYENIIKLQNQITFFLSLYIGHFITRHIRNTCLACVMKKKSCLLLLSSIILRTPACECHIPFKGTNCKPLSIFLLFLI